MTSTGEAGLEAVYKWTTRNTLHLAPLKGSRQFACADFSVLLKAYMYDMPASSLAEAQEKAWRLSAGMMLLPL